MDDTKFKISIQFELKNKGDWNGATVAAESLISIAVAALSPDDRPKDYLAPGKNFILIFERAFHDRIEALTWAKGIEESTLALWEEKKANIKNAEISPSGITIEAIESVKPAETS